MQLATHISDEELVEKISKELAKEGITRYQFLHKVINHYFEEPKDNDDIDTVDDFISSGDFEEDVKALDRSGIKTKSLVKELAKLDGQRKTKNSVKKTGAFHEENCILDIRSMVVSGKPNYHEIKYHMDWWERVGLISNVLARRGYGMNKRFKSLLHGFEARAEPSTGSHTTFKDRYSKIRDSKDKQSVGLR